MALELPIDDVTQYVEELLLLDEIGENAIIDGVETRIMLSDLQRKFSVIDNHSKTMVVSKKINFDKGSIVQLPKSNKVGIVYTTPNNDIVSYSCNVLITNAKLSIVRKEDVYDEDTLSPTYGDILSSEDVIVETLDGFVERISAKEKSFDAGVVHSAELRFTTIPSENIKLNDTVNVKGKTYKIVDIDDIDEQVITIQLEKILRVV